eukprot:TRINITY_DN5770_c0_g1_i11.p1 TRINITY_DN5770_c0_g1~~TRINITY_DN5770_c0_g1_i11.p1  ORF type:complete len:118 (-),score=23.05 TRINITY_DN5770_c0_g1_i11:585-938(-)
MCFLKEKKSKSFFNFALVADTPSSLSLLSNQSTKSESLSTDGVRIRGSAEFPPTKSRTPQLPGTRDLSASVGSSPMQNAPRSRSSASGGTPSRSSSVPNRGRMKEAPSLSIEGLGRL